jgi:putative membrane protein insertion efficiency factor
MRKVLISLVRAYQVTTINFAPRCKYYPSCSQYAVTAIDRYGVKGIAMSIWRLVRCNPWSQGGVDYVDTDLDSADVKKQHDNQENQDYKKEAVGAN